MANTTTVPVSLASSEFFKLRDYRISYPRVMRKFFLTEKCPPYYSAIAPSPLGDSSQATSLSSRRETANDRVHSHNLR
jgi:hypothetical protein